MSETPRSGRTPPPALTRSNRPQAGRWTSVFLPPFGAGRTLKRTREAAAPADTQDRSSDSATFAFADEAVTSELQDAQQAWTAWTAPEPYFRAPRSFEPEVTNAVETPAVAEATTEPEAAAEPEARAESGSRAERAAPAGADAPADAASFIDAPADEGSSPDAESATAADEAGSTTAAAGEPPAAEDDPWLRGVWSISDWEVAPVSSVSDEPWPDIEVFDVEITDHADVVDADVIDVELMSVEATVVELSDVAAAPEAEPAVGLETTERAADDAADDEPELDAAGPVAPSLDALEFDEAAPADAEQVSPGEPFRAPASEATAFRAWVEREPVPDESAAGGVGDAVTTEPVGGVVDTGEREADVVARRVADRLDALARQIRSGGIASLAGTHAPDELSRLIAAVVASYIGRDD
jgi:hypothetical protein